MVEQLIIPYIYIFISLVFNCEIISMPNISGRRPSVKYNLDQESPPVRARDVGMARKWCPDLVEDALAMGRASPKSGSLDLETDLHYGSDEKPRRWSRPIDRDSVFALYVARKVVFGASGLKLKSQEEVFQTQPTGILSRGLNTFQLVRPSQLSVESSFLAFAMALTPEICLVLDIVVFVSSLEGHLLRNRATGNLVKYSGLLEGGYDSVTLIDGVVGGQFLVPATTSGASTMVLHPAVPSWANLFKQIDACRGLSQMDGQSVEVSYHQTLRVNFLQAQLQSQTQQLYGQIETQNHSIQAVLVTWPSHIRGLLSNRPREEGE